MPASKIQDEQEVLRWFDEGRTYAEMVELYREKYSIETSISMWSNFRRRRGLERRITWDDTLIPWKVEEEHRYAYPILMLRREARRRAGFQMTPEQEHEIDAWIANMKSAGKVLHYRPDSARGWYYVAARPGVDLDLIREPEEVTRRLASD